MVRLVRQCEIKQKLRAFFLIIRRKSRLTLLNHTLALSVIPVWLARLNAAVIPKPHTHRSLQGRAVTGRLTSGNFFSYRCLIWGPIDWRVYGKMQRLLVHSDQHIPEENSSFSWVQQNVVRFVTNEEATTLLRLYVKSCCFDRHFACVKWNRAVGKCTRSAWIEPTGTSANKPAPSTKFNSSELISAFRLAPQFSTKCASRKSAVLSSFSTTRIIASLSRSSLMNGFHLVRWKALAGISISSQHMLRWQCSTCVYIQTYTRSISLCIIFAVFASRCRRWRLRGRPERSLSGVEWTLLLSHPLSEGTICSSFSSSSLYTTTTTTG